MAEHPEFGNGLLRAFFHRNPVRWVLRADVFGARPNEAVVIELLDHVARLSDGMRPVRLKLDSGSNVPFLYNKSEYMALGMLRGASLHGGSVAAQKTFMTLPPAGCQDRLCRAWQGPVHHPRRRTEEHPHLGVRWPINHGALQSRIHRPRRSLCRPGTMKTLKNGPFRLVCGQVGSSFDLPIWLTPTCG